MSNIAALVFGVELEGRERLRRRGRAPLGAVPVLGDLLGVLLRASLRNLVIIEEHVAGPPR